MKIFEKNFYQDQNKWKPNLISFEISINESDKVIDIPIYNNHYAPIEKLNVILGDKIEIFICRRCLNSYTSENNLLIHQPKCANYDIYTIRNSSESHLHRKDHLHKNPLHYGIIEDFEADNGIDNSSIGNKTTNTYKQNPVNGGFNCVIILFRWF